MSLLMECPVATVVAIRVLSMLSNGAVLVRPKGSVQKQKSRDSMRAAPDGFTGASKISKADHN